MFISIIIFLKLENEKVCNMKSKKRKGSIMMMTLLVVAVVGTLAVSFMLVSTQDFQIAKVENSGIRALYMARSGLEYYGANQRDMEPGTKKRIEIQGEMEKQYCDIEVKTEEVLSTGVISTKSGQVICKKTLKAPYGDILRWYEISR